MRVTIGVLAVLTATSCDLAPEKSASAPPAPTPTRAAARPTPRPRLEVFTDPAALEQARALRVRASAALCERLSAEMAKPRPSILSDELPRLKECHDLVGTVRDRARNRTLAASIRRPAAVTLLRLGDPEGWTLVAALLETDVRGDVLSDIGSSFSGVGEPPAEVRRRIAALATDPDLETALEATTYCLRRAVPAQRQHLATIARAAARERSPSLNEYLIRGALDAFLNAAQGPLRSDALRLSEKVFKTHPRRQFDVRTHARHADGESLAFLESELARPDPGRQLVWDKGEVLRALVRLKHPRVRALLLEALNGESGWIAVEPAAEWAAGTADVELVRRISETCGKGSSSTAPLCIRALSTIGGQEAQPAVRDLFKLLLPADQLALRVELSGMTLEGALDELKTRGLLPATARVDTSRLEARGGLHGRIREVLENAAVLLGFDTETGYLPVPHDRLVERFAAASAQQFRPEAVYQVWHSDEGRAGLVSDLDVPRLDRGYTVQFIHRGRLYRFHCDDLNDWYDTTAVAAAVNRALADAGRTERFTALHTGGQDSSYLFGTVEAVKFAAERGLVFVAASDAEAMQLGKDFERRALEALSKN